MGEPDLSEFHAEEEAAELRATIRRLELRLAKAKAKTADLIEAVYQAAKDAALVQGSPPAIPAPSDNRRSKRAEAAMLLCSDWHVGKHTPSYSTEVAAERVRLLGEKVAKIVEIERADHPVRECHALLNGDFVDNTAIFPGHAFEVDSTVFAQLFAGAGMLEGLLRQLLATFQMVHCWEQSGNHGRIGRRGDYARSDNLDVMLYRLARERLAEYERKGRLVWHEIRSWHTIVQAGSYRALLLHGDQIRSFGGNVPAYGILRKANAWASGVLDDFTDAYVGHFHQALVLPLANGKGRVFVNPSTESDSAYAKEFVAATGTPGQRLNFVDPERGRVTTERVLWLDDEGRAV